MAGIIAWFAAPIAAAALVAATMGIQARAGTMAPVKNPHGSFKGECALCHAESGWKPARISRKFDHGKFGFPLEGAHAAADCRACHASLEFAKAPAACASCHEDAHRGELGLDCARCHTARSFIDRVRMLQMHRTTRFPLVGSHAAVDCEGCHQQTPSGHLRFAGTDVECVSCHLKDYQAATLNHAASGFSTECRQCHGMTAWTPTGFDHSGTGFPLAGRHRAITCSSCHVGNTFSGLSPACASCHLDDYNGTTDPNHATSGFATTCADCHGTSRWSDARFAQHDAASFPIYSGTHKGRWSACSTCHNQPGNLSVFTCFSCHPHDSKTQTDSNHSGVGGYQYLSTACYSCHPDGRK